MSEEASIRPVARELLDARERAAGALAAAGASVRRESMRSIRRAMEYYLATLASAEGPDVWTLVSATPMPPKLSAIAREAPRGRGDHTLPLFFLLLGEKIKRRTPEGGSARRSRPAARSRARWRT